MSTRSCPSSPRIAFSTCHAGPGPEYSGHYGDDRHLICGDRAVSEWTLRGTRRTGEPIEVRGCDLLEFVDGKISRKDSYWKIVD